MAATRKDQPKRRGPGRQFEPGKSGNPSGLPAKVRETRLAVKDALDKAFTQPDGTDGLVTAIVMGVAQGDGVCIKLACEYRWGKPVQHVVLDPSELPDVELRKAAVEIAEEWKREGVMQ